MNNPHFLIVFHQVNYALASAMMRDLVPAGFTFSLLCDDDLGPADTLADRLREDQRPMILMVSDNFLRSAECVYQLLPVLQARENTPIQIVVLTEGMRQPDQEVVPTRLDRVGQILQYINYWQDRYLQLRKAQSHPDTRDSVSGQELQWTRQIAFEIGDLIEFFREHASYAWEAFTANKYELFFRKSGNISLHEDFRQGLLYPEDDRELEQRVRDQVEQLRQEETEEETQSPTPVGELVEELNGTTGATPEKELLNRLIAYKNQLQQEDEEESDLPEEDDDWDDEEPEVEERLGEDDGGAAIVTMPARDEAGIRRLLEKDPDNITLLLDLAFLLAHDEATFNETTSLLEKVLTLDPTNARAFFLLGKLSEQYKEKKLAQSYYEKALKSTPDYAEAHLALGRMLLKEPNHLEEGIAHLGEARKLLPDHAEVWAEYGEALLLNDETKKAAKAFKKAFKLDPDNEYYPTRLAELYFQMGDRVKALRYYKEKQRGPAVPEDKPTPVQEIPPPVHAPEAASTHLKEVEDHRPAAPVSSPSQVLTVLITGATSGIGRATARLFAEKGHRLILTGRREDRLFALQAELEQLHNASILPLAFDIRQEAVTRQLIRALPESWTKIDVLINNAGGAHGLAPIHEGNVEDWDAMIDTNIKGLLYMTRAVTPGMVARQAGHVINVCSTAGKETYPNGNVYCATKHAVDALTKAIRQDLMPHRVCVSQVSPGHVEETEFALVRFAGDKERARIYEDFNPLTARDVADAIYYMITRPAHVQIHDIVLTGSQQATSTQIDRSGRIYD